YPEARNWISACRLKSKPSSFRVRPPYADDLRRHTPSRPEHHQTLTMNGPDLGAGSQTGGITTNTRYQLVCAADLSNEWGPPQPTEALVDLDRLTTSACFYRGSARDAARDCPKNANVAAAVALAGLGFEATEVELIAEPAAPGNCHKIAVEGVSGTMRINLTCVPSPSNPKTSMLTALSVARMLLAGEAGRG
ncbi:MAG: DUF108 domain-containing protein, partial [Alphaproteobacteria bacterium]